MINKIVLILLYFLLVLVYILSIIFAKEDHFALNFPIEKKMAFSQNSQKKAWKWYLTHMAGLCDPDSTAQSALNLRHVHHAR